MLKKFTYQKKINCLYISTEIGFFQTVLHMKMFDLYSSMELSNHLLEYKTSKIRFFLAEYCNA